MNTIHETRLPGLELLNRGKVRDVYALDADRLLMIATDRLSAFDVVLPDPIPGKGTVLTALANFWFDRTKSILPNHIADARPWATDPKNEIFTGLKGRAIIAKRAQPVMLEAVVRGYLTGSGLVEYNRSGTVCGIKLPVGLTEASQLPEPIFTPSTKAPKGQHDENVSFDQACDIVGKDMATRVRDAAIALYKDAATFARTRGIIIADTKFEFGIRNGELIVIDEMITPDSSRFWPLDGWAPGKVQPSFDKQFVRDWLLAAKWNKQPPAPNLPADVIAKTAAKYRDAVVRIDPANEALNWI